MSVSNVARILWPIIVTAALAACGGGSSSGPQPATPPVLSNLNYSPHSVAQSAGGTAPVGGTFDFSDSGGDLSTVTLAVYDSNGAELGSQTANIQDASGRTSGTIQASITIKIDNAGLYTFKVSASDQGGSTSNVLQGPFRISLPANLAPVVAATKPGPRELKAAGGYLYWSEQDQNVIKRVPVTGGAIQGLAQKVIDPSAAVFAGTDVIWLDQVLDGAPCEAARVVNRTTAAGATTLVAQAAFCATLNTLDVVADAGNVYWVESTQAPDTYLIRAMPLNGGSITTIASTPTPVITLKAHGGVVYWLERTTSSPTRWVRSVPAGGGAVTTIVDGFPAASDTFAVDATAVYYANTISIPGTPATISLQAQPLAGGAPITLAANVRQPIDLASDGTTLVWTDSIPLGAPGSTHVNAIPTAGGTPVVLASSALNPVGLLIAGGNALWSEDRVNNQGMPGLYSVPLSGGAVTTLYQGQDAPHALTLDGSGQICWTEPGYPTVSFPDGSGRIARLVSPMAGQTLVEGIYRDSPTFIVVGTDIVVADWNRLKRVPIGGGVIETLSIAQAPIASLTSDGTTVYFDAGPGVYGVPLAGGATTLVTPGAPGTSQGGPIRLAPNGNLYWVADNTNVATVPTGGGTPSVVALGMPIGPLAVGPTAVYVGFQNFPGISMIPLAGGPASGLTITNQNGGASVADLVVDGSNIYWIDSLQIAKVPLSGGDADAPVAFTSQVAFGSDTSNLAVDSGHLYWSEPNPLDIRSAPK